MKYCKGVCDFTKTDTGVFYIKYPYKDISSNLIVCFVKKIMNTKIGSTVDIPENIKKSMEELMK